MERRNADIDRLNERHRCAVRPGSGERNLHRPPPGAQPWTERKAEPHARTGLERPEVPRLAHGPIALVHADRRLQAANGAPREVLSLQLYARLPLIARKGPARHRPDLKPLARLGRYAHPADGPGERPLPRTGPIAYDRLRLARQRRTGFRDVGRLAHAVDIPLDATVRREMHLNANAIARLGAEVRPSGLSDVVAIAKRKRRVISSLPDAEHQANSAVVLPWGLYRRAQVVPYGRQEVERRAVWLPVATGHDLSLDRECAGKRHLAVQDKARLHSPVRLAQCAQTVRRHLRTRAHRPAERRTMQEVPLARPCTCEPERARNRKHPCPYVHWFVPFDLFRIVTRAETASGDKGNRETTTRRRSCRGRVRGRGSPRSRATPRLTGRIRRCDRSRGSACLRRW